MGCVAVSYASDRLASTLTRVSSARYASGS